MTERPILFSDAMVRALLAGTKTQTRRVITSRDPISFIGCRGEEDDPSAWGWFFDGPDHHGYMVLGRGHDERHDHGSISIPCPYGSAGDRLWVRETWAYCGGDEYLYQCDPAAVAYRADETNPCRQAPGGRWRPSIYMPRWASRLTLEVTDVRVERLQSISEDDARAEGVTPFGAGVGGDQRVPGRRDDVTQATSPHVVAFASLWDSINGERSGCSWGDDPWVWAVSFRRVEVER